MRQGAIPGIKGPEMLRFSQIATPLQKNPGKHQSSLIAVLIKLSPYLFYDESD